jgi:radical SAM protein with 4Fe4S-binding SPASM domain
MDDEYVNFFSAPTMVWWDVTNQCNFNCIHCYSRSSMKNDNSDELTLIEAKKLIDELADAGVFYIFFLGGEPFIRNDFLEILSYVKHKGIDVSINTNGWFINKNIAKYLKNIGVNRINISLDGPTEKIHDSFRMKTGSFNRVINAVKNLLDANIPNIGIVSTISKYNINELDQIIDLAANLGASSYQCVVLTGTGRGLDNYSDLGLSGEDFQKLRFLINEYSSKYMNKMFVYSIEGVWDKPEHRCVQKGLVRPDFMGCRAGRTCCNINYNGDIIPCLLVREPVAGNIRSQTFKQIWDDSPVFNNFRKKRVDLIECKDCEWNDICVRECPVSPSQLEIDSKTRMNNIQYIKSTWENTKPCTQSQICHSDKPF